MAKDAEIHDRLSRVEEIIEQLDADEVPPDEGSDLYEEGKELLSETRKRLQGRNGEVIEIE